jgi:hypothetical protein
MRLEKRTQRSESDKHRKLARANDRRSAHLRVLEDSRQQVSSLAGENQRLQHLLQVLLIDCTAIYRMESTASALLSYPALLLLRYSYCATHTTVLLLRYSHYATHTCCRYCTVLLCTALLCTALLCTVLYCTVLYCTPNTDVCRTPTAAAACAHYGTPTTVLLLQAEQRLSRKSKVEMGEAMQRQRKILQEQQQDVQQAVVREQQLVQVMYTMYYAPCTMHHAPCTIHYALCSSWCRYCRL